MKNSKCLICNGGNEVFMDSDGTGVDEKCPISSAVTVIYKHLQVIFILRNILQLPVEQLVEWLESYPNLEGWITVCGGCEGLVSECWRFHGELLEITRKFNGSRLKVVNIIRENKAGEARSENGSLRGVYEECRDFVVDHEYWEEGPNPFKKGDLKAREKLAEFSTEKEREEETTPETFIKEEAELQEDGPDNNELYEEVMEDENMSPYLEEYDLKGTISNEESESDSDTDDGGGGNFDDDDDWCPNESEEDHGVEQENSDPEKEEDEQTDNSSSLEENSTDDELSSRPGNKMPRKQNRIRRYKNKPKFSCPFCEVYRYSISCKKGTCICNHLEKCREQNNGKSGSNPEEEVTKLSCHLCSKYSCSTNDILLFVNHLLSCYHFHKTVELKHRIFECSICKEMKTDTSQNFFDLDNFLKHISKHKQFKYKCSQCGELRMNITSCQRHWRKKHKDLLDSIDKTEWQLELENEVSPSIPWWCTKCGDTFNDETQRDNHFQNEHPSNWTSFKIENCNFCDKSYPCPDELKLHKVIHHLLEDTKCQECSEVFQTNNLLLNHRRMVHKLDMFKCDQCPSQFRLKYNLTAHQKKVHDPTRKHLTTGRFKPKERKPKPPPKIKKPPKLKLKLKRTTKKPRPLSIKCEEEGCSEYFPNLRQLELHKRTVHKEKIKCGKCEKWFHSPLKLQKHICNIHVSITEKKKEKKKRQRKKANVTTPTEDGPYICEICGKTFTAKQGVTLHKQRTLECKRLHMSEEDATVVCDLCGKRYSSKFGLAKHIRERHEGRFKEKCEHCGKGVEDKGKLKFHLAKVHKIGNEAGKYVQCLEEGCEGQVFRNKKTLEYHLAQKHGKGEAQFKCKECDKSFFFPKYLGQHVAVVHKGYRWKPKPK